MKVIGVAPLTGQEVEIEIKDPEGSFLEVMRTFDVSDEAIKKIIDTLNISADAKSLLYTLSKATIMAGQYVVKIGRKILDAVCHTLKEFPMAAFGTVFGGIVGALISSTPVLGQMLGPIVTPILMALGMVGGLVLDFQDKMLEKAISRKVAEFSPLAAQYRS